MCGACNKIFLRYVSSAVMEPSVHRVPVSPW